MKLRTYKQKKEHKETDIDLPVYLYFQDEFCNEIYVKVEEKQETTVSYTLFGCEIKVEKSDGSILEHHLDRMTTKEYYEEHLKEVLENIS